MKFFTIYVKAFQSIYDLAVQQYGSVDHIDVLISDNPTLDLENDLAVGTQVKIRTEMSVLDEAALKYFTESGDQVATWENNGVSPGYTPGFSSCPVANVNAKNSDDETVATGTAPSGGTGTLNIPDTNIEAVNTDDITLATGSVPSASVIPGKIIIPDVEVIVNGVSQGDKKVTDPIIITPTNIIYIRPANSGYGTTSYLTGDEGYNETNYPAPAAPAFGIPAFLDPSNPKLLLNNNAFGHKHRFTGVNGGYYDYNTSQYKLSNGTVSDQATVFGTTAGSSSYIIDNHTGLGWKWNIQGATIFSTHITNILGLTHATFTDWFLPSRPMLWSLYATHNLGTGITPLIPFNSSASCKTSTPSFGAETTNHNMITAFSSYTQSRADGTSDGAYACRWHF